MINVILNIKIVFNVHKQNAVIVKQIILLINFPLIYNNVLKIAMMGKLILATNALNVIAMFLIAMLVLK